MPPRNNLNALLIQSNQKFYDFFIWLGSPLLFKLMTIYFSVSDKHLYSAALKAGVLGVPEHPRNLGVQKSLANTASTSGFEKLSTTLDLLNAIQSTEKKLSRNVH